MDAAMATAGLKLERFIGPQTAHKYHDATKAELTTRFETLIAKGRDAVPSEIRFSTYTLRYPESSWVRIEGLRNIGSAPTSAPAEPKVPASPSKQKCQRTPGHGFQWPHHHRRPAAE